MPAEQEPTAALVANYSAVDSSSQVEPLIARLERNEEHPMWARARRRSHELLGARAGTRVLDVGCGTGRAVAELRHDGVHATGVDSSERMIERARIRFPEADFRVAKAEALPFVDGHFLGYRAERVYRHLADPVSAIAEAWRVLGSGGRIVLVDLVPEMGLIDANDTAQTHAWSQTYADTLTNRWFCHRAGSLLVDVGFTCVDAELEASMQTSYVESADVIPRAAVAAGTASLEQANAWIAEQRQRSAEGRYFQMRPFVLWSAWKP